MNPDNAHLARTACKLTNDVLKIAVTQVRPERALDVVQPVVADELAGRLFYACLAFSVAEPIGLRIVIRPGTPEGPELHAMRLISAASQHDNSLLDDFSVVAARQPWEWQRELLLVLFHCVADAAWIRGALS